MDSNVVVETLKVVLGSPLFSGMLLGAIGRVWIVIANHLNAGSSIKAIHYMYLAMPLVMAFVKGLDQHSLTTDPQEVQNLVNYYANTLMVHFGLEQVQKGIQTLPLRRK